MCLLKNIQELSTFGFLKNIHPSLKNIQHLIEIIISMTRIAIKDMMVLNTLGVVCPDLWKTQRLRVITTMNVMVSYLMMVVLSINCENLMGGLMLLIVGITQIGKHISTMRQKVTSLISTIE